MAVWGPLLTPRYFDFVFATCSLSFATYYLLQVQSQSAELFRYQEYKRVATFRTAVHPVPPPLQPTCHPHQSSLLFLLPWQGSVRVTNVGVEHSPCQPGSLPQPSLYVRFCDTRFGSHSDPTRIPPGSHPDPTRLGSNRVRAVASGVSTSFKQRRERSKHKSHTRHGEASTKTKASRSMMGRITSKQRSLPLNLVSGIFEATVGAIRY